MSDDDDENSDGLNDLPDQWWLLALIVGMPFFFYYWLADGEQFKGSVIGCVVGGIVLSSGFYLQRFRSPLFWLVILVLLIIQVPPLMLTQIYNVRGPTYGIFFPLMSVEAGLTFFAIKYAFKAIERK